MQLIILQEPCYGVLHSSLALGVLRVRIAYRILCVYVGVHYPFDVLGGALVGLCCAGFVITLYSYTKKS